MKAYISGPMSGIADYNRLAFHEAAKELRSAGYEVLNPAEIIIMGGTWQDYMKKDIAMLMNADIVFMLPGWTHSRGASIECNLASSLDIKIQSYELWQLKERAKVNESVKTV